MRRLTIVAVLMGLVFPASAVAGPRYDVPPGFTRCPHAEAWHGFFKWASARNENCRDAGRFMRRYAERAGATMPRSVAGYRCRIHYWRNEEGDIYASRHVCRRGETAIRFYGMV
jgi:hypothetical protein